MSQSFILPFEGSSVISSEGAPGKPRILWNNLMSNGSPSSITASNEPDPADYPYQNCYDGRPYTYFKMEAGTRYLTFVFPSAKTVNSYAHYSPGEETIGSLGGQLTLQYSTNGGASWSDAQPTETPTDNSPIYRSFSNISAARWRWKFVCATDFYVACLSFGEEMQFERGCWVGFSPPKLARATTLTNNTSQEGNWLGRSIIRRGSEFSFDLDSLTPDFVRTYWYDFMVWAERKSWFLLWNKEDYPAEAAFCWSVGDIGKPTYSHSNFMSAKMKVEARVDG